MEGVMRFEEPREGVSLPWFSSQTILQMLLL